LIVEKILDRRIINGRLQYKVRWFGFSEDDDTWEDFYKLDPVSFLLDEFDDNYMDADDNYMDADDNLAEQELVTDPHLVRNYSSLILACKRFWHSLSAMFFELLDLIRLYSFEFFRRMFNVL
uniref:Chromo domain-containing protein n=1 Tax=Gongylonema pulchrum TaxID=637853 RepID=A0A183EME1_9BILA